jgi:hypothetical protein
MSIDDSGLSTVDAEMRIDMLTGCLITITCVQEQGPVLGWEGAIMSVFSREAADWEGSGYGPMLATPSVRMDLFPPQCAH